MDVDTTKRILESVLLAAGKPLDVERLDSIFDLGEGEDRPNRDEIRHAIKALQEDYQGRGIELVEVASGYRFQVPQGMEPWVARLYEEKPPRYSRALLETLSIIAYRQPITRGEIEDIRGVAVSSNITKTLQEREWVRVVGHKDVPGKPAMFATTREFLDYFSLKTLDELPSLAELRDLESFNPQLELGEGMSSGEAASEEGEEDQKEAVDAPSEPEVVAQAEVGSEVPAADNSSEGELDESDADDEESSDTDDLKRLADSWAERKRENSDQASEEQESASEMQKLNEPDSDDETSADLSPGDALLAEFDDEDEPRR